MEDGTDLGLYPRGTTVRTFHFAPQAVWTLSQVLICTGDLNVINASPSLRLVFSSQKPSFLDSLEHSPSVELLWYRPCSDINPTVQRLNCMIFHLSSKSILSHSRQCVRASQVRCSGCYHARKLWPPLGIANGAADGTYDTVTSADGASSLVYAQRNKGEGFKAITGYNYGGKASANPDMFVLVTQPLRGYFESFHRSHYPSHSGFNHRRADDLKVSV